MIGLARLVSSFTGLQLQLAVCCAEALAVGFVTFCRVLLKFGPLFRSNFPTPNCHARQPGLSTAGGANHAGETNLLSQPGDMEQSA